MAKTKGPLLSLDAHGSLGHVLTYSHRKSGRQVRKYTKPLIAASAKQRGQRRLTEFLVAQWQNMSAGDKATWEAAARVSGPNIAGYHYFLREAQRDLYTHHGLCGYWHCNEIVGGKVLDLSGNAYHGTLKPAPPANAPVLIDSYKTKFSKGLLYDGVDEKVDIGAPARLNITGKITLITWVKPAVGSGQQGLVGTNTVNAGYSLFLRHSAGGDIAFRFNPDGTDRFKTTGTLIYGNWYQIVGTWDEIKMRVHLNGILLSDTHSTVSIGRNFDNVVLGWGSNLAAPNFLEGIQDEVCIYNRALSTAEILTRYRFGIREVD